MKFIRSAKDHCGCAAIGHNPDKLTIKQVPRNVKSMFGRTKKPDIDTPVAEREVITEEEVKE